MQTHECKIHVKCSRCVKFKCLKWWAKLQSLILQDPLNPETLNNNQRNIYIFESEAFIEPFDN